jgi:hypothetical protein
VFVVRFFPLAGFQEVSEWGVVHAHLLFERERDDGTVSKRETKRSILRAREYHLEMMIAFFQFIHKIRKQRTLLLLTSDFNSGSGFSVVAAADDDTDADADDAASGAALVFVVFVVVFSAVSASAATLTALTLLDFCFNDVDVLFVPPLLFDDDAVA